MARAAGINGNLSPSFRDGGRSDHRILPVHVYT